MGKKLNIFFWGARINKCILDHALTILGNFNIDIPIQEHHIGILGKLIVGIRGFYFWERVN
jgi:hypothetical protein